MYEKEKRKNYYINKRFQGKFIAIFFALIVMGTMLSGSIIYLMSQTTVTTTFEDDATPRVQATSNVIMPAVMLASVIVIVTVGITTIFVTLFISHKIAGPLYRIEKDIDEVRAGNLKVIFNLRQGDQVRPIAVRLNDMVGFLHDKILSIKQNLVLVEEWLTKTPEKSPEEIKEAIKKIRAVIDKFLV